MKNEQDLMNYINKISQKEIEELRINYKENKTFDDYLFKKTKKVRPK